MWLDNASDIDMLFYSPYAEIIVNFTKNADLTPFTIGLYGSWGAGKSSLLHLIEQKLTYEEKIETIVLNAWQFEGYEDAKVAIMESLLLAISERKTFAEKVSDKIKSLIKRINYLRLGKDLAKKGVPYAIGAITGNPIPITVNVAAELADCKSLSDKINEFKSNYLKPEDNETQTDSIRKFKDEFEEMLSSVTSLDNLVVIVDDLDRCTPDRIIDTLEAIKLFLSVKKTTFIIAVDQSIIEYAVNTKYKQIEGFGVSSDYIEKIIQLPIKIPELSSKDIENYLLLLICQLYFKSDDFKTLVKKIHEEKYMLMDHPISISEIEKIASELSLKNSFLKYDEFKEDAAIIEKVRSTISSSLKGNPRQTKRFLNAFFVRKNLAPLYFGQDVDLAIIAKLLALEFIDMKAFRKIYEWNIEFDGENKQLKELENAVINNDDISEHYSLWNKMRLKNWIKSEPVELYKVDLSKYFYLSRESLVSLDNASSAFSEKERKMLSDIMYCIEGQEDTRISELKAMDSISQLRVIEAIIKHFKNDDIKLKIISRIFKEFPDYQSDIIMVLKDKEQSFFGLYSIPLLTRMYWANNAEIENLLNELKQKGYIQQEMIDQIMVPQDQ